MNPRLLTLAGRIRSELEEIEQAVRRAPIAWERAEQSADDLYLDSAALNLHSFYSGVEKIFELIAQQIDMTKLQDGHWHQQLLRQMAAEIPKIRPPVISTRTRDELDEYRSFRHVVRNVYAFTLSPGRMKHLIENLGPVFERIRNELETFAATLESQSESPSPPTN